MTPDKPKCEHTDIQWDEETPETRLRCPSCGQRWFPKPPFTGTAQAILERHANSVTVPSDVLEELRALVVATRDCVCFPGDSPCQECIARIETAARRIDGVLGK